MAAVRFSLGHPEIEVKGGWAMKLRITYLRPFPVRVCLKKKKKILLIEWYTDIFFFALKSTAHQISVIWGPCLFSSSYFRFSNGRFLSKMYGSHLTFLDLGWKGDFRKHWCVNNGNSTFKEKNLKLEGLSSCESLKKNLWIMVYNIIFPQGPKKWKRY